MSHDQAQHQPMEVEVGCWPQPYPQENGGDMFMVNTDTLPNPYDTLKKMPKKLVQTPWPNTWPRLLAQPAEGNGPIRRESLKSSPFQFQRLLPELKVKIFQYLLPVEKAVYRRVCVDWKRLLSNGLLWQRIDFSVVPRCINKRPLHRCSQLCYMRYCKRVKEFAKFLKNCRPAPAPGSLHFEFDIREPNVEWRTMILGLLEGCNTDRLSFVHMNWKETPFQRKWCGAELPNDLHYRHRLRQRIFLAFFDEFVTKCLATRTLVMPFEWSDRSIDTLGRLAHLHTLMLQRYFDFSAPSQEAVTKVLSVLPALLRFVLEIWCSSGQEFTTYHITHRKMQYLDVSQSRGFYICEMDMPRLRCFKISKHPWTSHHQTLFGIEAQPLPCLHQVLREGAPALEQINEHRLQRGWRDGVYPKLEEVLGAICSCSRHKRPAMLV